MQVIPSLTVFSRHDDFDGGVGPRPHVVDGLNFDVVLPVEVLLPNLEVEPQKALAVGLTAKHLLLGLVDPPYGLQSTQ